MDTCINSQHLTNALPTRYHSFPYTDMWNSTRYHALPSNYLKKVYVIFFNKKVVTRGNALHSQKNQCNTKLTGGNAYGNALVTRW